LNGSEVSANVTFLAKLSHKEIYKKVALRLGLINLIVCHIGEVLTTLHCCKVLAGNSYKAFTKKIQHDPST
jgi:hypothetical protein